jgi:hypothetical protein
MPDLPNPLLATALYASAFFSALAYIIWLQTLKRRYGRAYHDWLFMTVVGGTLLTYAWLALQFYFLPPTPDAGQPLATIVQEVLWWAWGKGAWMFLATGLPVAAVEINEMRRRYIDTLD